MAKCHCCLSPQPSCKLPELSALMSGSIKPTSDSFSLLYRCNADIFFISNYSARSVQCQAYLKFLKTWKGSKADFPLQIKVICGKDLQVLRSWRTKGPKTRNSIQQSQVTLLLNAEWIFIIFTYPCKVQFLWNTFFFSSLNYNLMNKMTKIF